MVSDSCNADSYDNNTKGPGREKVTPKEHVDLRTGNNYIITIGIDDYSKSKFNSLKSCINDCKSLVKVLQDKYSFIDVCKDAPLYDDNADLDGIRTFFKKLRKSDIAKDENATLIIFFSGHGHIFKQLNEEPIPCWVPSDCDDDEFHDYFFTISELFEELKYINTRHILVITDCCYAGGIQEVPTYFDSNEKGGGESHTAERSRWTLTSSRSNELSGAGGPGKMSLFTNILVETLIENTSRELSLAELISNVEKRFDAQDIKNQYPSSGRLKIIGLNSGQPVLVAKDAVTGLQKKKQKLPGMLSLLNYTKERRLLSFTDEDQPLTPLILLSGNEHTGLKYLLRLACDDLNFPAFGSVKRPVVIPALYDTSTPLSVPFFNNALGLNCSSYAELLTRLQERLNREHILLEINFRSGELEFPLQPEQKTDILKALSQVLQKLNQQDYHIFIFVLDYESHRYEKVELSPLILMLDQIDSLKPADIKYWYNNIYGSTPAKEKQELQDLFKTDILDNAGNLAAKEGTPPGAVIRNICVKAGCSDLAEELLDN
jgi:hypothetical protein